jgi:hypothetical protein
VLQTDGERKELVTEQRYEEEVVLLFLAPLLAVDLFE